MPDLTADFQPDGYSPWPLPLPTLLCCYLNNLYTPLLLWAMSTSRAHGFGWSFPLGISSPPNVPFESTPLTSMLVAWWVLWSVMTAQLSASQAFHTAHRCLYSGGSILAPTDRERSVVVDLPTVAPRRH